MTGIKLGLNTNIDKWIFDFPEVVEIAKFQSVFSESDRAHMVTGHQRPLRARNAPSWHKDYITTS